MFRNHSLQGRRPCTDDSTLFLDEIGDLSQPLQAKLLRFLENHRITPVGGNEETAVDVRVLAATHRRLESLIAEGKFRTDLYYRLNVVRIAIPPLRERREDIPPLMSHFLDRFSRQCNQPAPELDAELTAYLEHHPWPGNIRQLRNCMESLVVLGRGNRLLIFFETERGGERAGRD